MYHFNMYECIYVCVCVHACVRAGVRACARTCGWVGAGGREGGQAGLRLEAFMYVCIYKSVSQSVRFLSVCISRSTAAAVSAADRVQDEELYARSTVSIWKEVISCNSCL